MAKNIVEIPYTELQERIKDMGRVPENSKPKIRGFIGDVYHFEIPMKFDWNFLFTSSSITTEPSYSDGTVSINTGSTSLSFSSQATLSQDMNKRKIKIEDAIYDFYYTSSSSGTINPPYQGNSNASSVAYCIFKSRYSLAGDFDRFPKNGGIYRWQGGTKQVLPEWSYQEELKDYSASPGLPSNVRMVDQDTKGCLQIEMTPPPRDSKVYGYDYIRRPKPLNETSSGTVTITGATTTVSGSSNCRFTEATTGDYLRVNAFGIGEDSSWYKIISIAHDSSLTIATSFANTSVVNATYVISSAPEFPARLHLAVLYGPLRNLVIDQSDDSAPLYAQYFKEAIDDAKRLYVSRVYSQDIDNVTTDFEYRR